MKIQMSPFELERPQLARWNLHLLRITIWAQMAAISLFGIALLCTPVARRIEGQAFGLFLVLGAPPAIFLVYWLWSRGFVHHRDNSGFFTQQRLTITENSISWEDASGARGEIPWDRILSSSKFEDCYALKIARYMYILVPTGALASESDRSDFEALLQTRFPKSFAPSNR